MVRLFLVYKTGIVTHWDDLAPPACSNRTPTVCFLFLSCGHCSQGCRHCWEPLPICSLVGFLCFLVPPPEFEGLSCHSRGICFIFWELFFVGQEVQHFFLFMLLGFWFVPFQELVLIPVCCLRVLPAFIFLDLFLFTISLGPFLNNLWVEGYSSSLFTFPVGCLLCNYVRH